MVTVFTMPIVGNDCECYRMTIGKGFHSIHVHIDCEGGFMRVIELTRKWSVWMCFCAAIRWRIVNYLCPLVNLFYYMRQHGSNLVDTISMWIGENNINIRRA